MEISYNLAVAVKMNRSENFLKTYTLYPFIRFLPSNGEKGEACGNENDKVAGGPTDNCIIKFLRTVS